MVLTARADHDATLAAASTLAELIPNRRSRFTSIPSCADSVPQRAGRCPRPFRRRPGSTSLLLDDRSRPMSKPAKWSDPDHKLFRIRSASPARRRTGMPRRRIPSHVARLGRRPRSPPPYAGVRPHARTASEQLPPARGLCARCRRRAPMSSARSGRTGCTPTAPTTTTSCASPPRCRRSTRRRSTWLVSRSCRRARRSDTRRSRSTPCTSGPTGVMGSSVSCGRPGSMWSGPATSSIRASSRTSRSSTTTPGSSPVISRQRPSAMSRNRAQCRRHPRQRHVQLPW